MNPLVTRSTVYCCFLLLQQGEINHNQQSKQIDISIQQNTLYSDCIKYFQYVHAHVLIVSLRKCNFQLKFVYTSERRWQMN